MKIAVISPKCTSESAKYIAQSLTSLLPEHEVVYFNPYQERKRGVDFFINYGCSGYTEEEKPFINKPTAVAKAVNKLTTLSLVKNGVTHTTNFIKAKEWIVKGKQVVCRKTATGTRSEGITIVSTEHELQDQIDCAFWTEYEPHHYELRINCYKNKIISILQKDTITNAQGENVFSFKLLKGTPHEELQEMVNDVYEKIGLDICGLDVLLTHKNKFKLLEVNSGPMLFGVTGVHIVNAIKKDIDNYVNRN